MGIYLNPSPLNGIIVQMPEIDWRYWHTIAMAPCWRIFF